MDFKNQENGPDSSSSIPFKKKRGRPRKDQSQNPSRIANLVTMSDQIQAHGDYGYIPPGYATVNGNLSHEGNAVCRSDDVMVGQTVQGVVEATFDTGYLLSVRIGNSETCLRAVVFKPGQFAPFSTDTDVAPLVQMISKKLASFFSGHQTSVHASYRKGRGRGRGKPRSDSHFMYSDNGLVTDSGKQLQVGPAQPDTLLCDRGTVVPVVLEPANQSSHCVSQPIETMSAVSQSTKTTSSVSQPAHLAASKARLVKRTQVDQLEKDLKTDNSPPSMEEARKIDGSAVKLPGAVMEELVNQVLRRIQGSTQPKETRTESGQASGAFTYGYERMQDLNEPILAEPPQALHANHFSESPFSWNFGCARPGKMTELLLAVQGNVIDKQTAGVQNHVFSRQ